MIDQSPEEIPEAGTSEDFDEPIDSDNPVNDRLVKMAKVIIVAAVIVVSFLSGAAYNNHQKQHQAQQAMAILKQFTSSYSNSVNPSDSPSPTAGLPADKGLAIDKSFRLDSIVFRNEADGTHSGTARLTNFSDTSKTGFFTITIFQKDDKTPLEVLKANVSEVGAGQQVTVEFLGTDPLPSWKFTYQFQTDIEM